MSIALKWREKALLKERLARSARASPFTCDVLPI